jgi:DNA polymerase-3 subunit epsilon
MNPIEAEIAVTGLHGTSDYKVLRRMNLNQDSRFADKVKTNPRIGLCLDTETTGLNPACDKIIELGIVAFLYDPLTAGIIKIIDRYAGFEDPGLPLSAETTAITGITDDMVSGKSFDDDYVCRLADQASLVIAHNAAFDRKFVEARFPVFSKVPWGCSMTQVDWQAERISTRVLEYLLFKFGWFINAHRALDDAEGLLGILLESLPVSGTPIFKVLLERFDEVTAKVCAVGAPFEKKDVLKQRGYRWNDGAQGGCKSWWTSVSGDMEREELAWLANEVYPRGVTDSVEITRIDALDRFSIRER